MQLPSSQPQNVDNESEYIIDDSDDISDELRNNDPDTLNNVLFKTVSKEHSGQRLDATLASIIPELSRSKLTNWIKNNQVLLNNNVAKPKDKVYFNDAITIQVTKTNEELAFTPEEIELDIVYEDEDIIIINKPAGLTVHPGNGNWSGTLLNGLLFHYPELKYLDRAGIVHRLDKDTSGLMVVARSTLAQTSLVRQLQSHTVSRIYRAIVHGITPDKGTIKTNIGRDPKNRLKMAVLQIGGKESITHYRTLKSYTTMSHVECRLETGRTHQIRVHMKHLSHPLVGDITYNKNKNYKYENIHIDDAVSSLNRQALHALKLSFIHPRTNQLVEFKSRLPEDMRYLLKQLELLQFNDIEIDDFDDEDDDHDWEIIYAK